MTEKSPKELPTQASISLVKKTAPNRSKFSGLKQTRQLVSLLLVFQAALIGVNGNLDVLSGKPVLNVLQGMITQGIELIIKAQGVQKRLKKSDRKPYSDQ